MQPAKKILVAMAFTEYSQGLFDYAAMLAQAMNAQLVAVNIINERDVEAVAKIESLGYDVDGAHFIANSKQERSKALEAIIQKSGFDADRVISVIKVGNPIDELLKITIGESADMIVLGVKGHTDLEHVFIGSVAEKIFRRSSVPVVSYRNEATAAKLRKRIG